MILSFIIDKNIIFILILDYKKYILESNMERRDLFDKT